MKKSILIVFVTLYAVTAFAQLNQRKTHHSSRSFEQVHKMVDRLNNYGRTAISLAKGTQIDERLISQSFYSDTIMIDSTHYTYSGSRSSYFSFNYMNYSNSYDLDGSKIFGFGSYVGFLDQNDAPSALSDTTVMYGLNLFTFNFEKLQNWYMLYDSNSNITTFSNVYTDSTNFPNGRYDNTFDSLNNIVKSIAMSWSGTQWDSTEWRIFKYNVSHQLIEDSTYGFDGVSWSPLEKWLYTYDMYGNVTQADYYEFDGANWNGNERYLMTYSNSTNLITLTDEIFDGANWLRNARDVFAYNGTDPFFYQYNETTYTNGILSDSSVFTKHITGGLPDTVFGVYFDDSANIISKNFTAYDYDSYDEPSVAYNYDYDMVNNVYDSVPSTTHYYRYETYFKPSKVYNITSSLDIQIYPNPANNMLYIDLPSSELYHLTLSDIYGRRVLFAEGAGRQSLNTAGLAQGLYILSVYDKAGQKIKTEKITKQ